MRRETETVILVLLGGALLKIGVTGDYLRYVKPSFLPFVLLAGAITALLGLVAIVRDIRAVRAATSAAHGRSVDGRSVDGRSVDGRCAGDGVHDHAGRSPWLLVAPVLAILLVAPPALGADSVTRSDTSAAPVDSGTDFAPLPDDAIPALRIGDLVTRVVWDDSGSLDGRRVRLTGFLVHREDGTTSLARLSISCCAADARPVQVRLTADGAVADQLATAPQDGWFEVTGQVVPDSATRATRYVPEFRVGAMVAVPAPAEPYEF